MWFLSEVTQNFGVLRDKIEKQKRKSIPQLCRTVTVVGTRILLTLQTLDPGGARLELLSLPESSPFLPGTVFPQRNGGMNTDSCRVQGRSLLPQCYHLNPN